MHTKSQTHVRISVLKTLTPWHACAAFVFLCPSALAEEPTPLAAKRAAAVAINHAKQIGLMLIAFDTEYGSLPHESTLADVEKISGKKLPVGDKSSNAMFRQFFSAGLTISEAPFFADIPGVVRGVGQKEPAKALGKGKNGFAYIAGLSLAQHPATPVVVCPLVPGTTRFDPKPFGGKAVILRLDLSAQLLPIEQDGRVLVDGVDLLSKENPVWKGEIPDIRYPDLPAAE